PKSTPSPPPHRLGTMKKAPGPLAGLRLLRHAPSSSKERYQGTRRTGGCPARPLQRPRARADVTGMAQRRRVPDTDHRAEAAAAAVAGLRRSPATLALLLSLQDGFAVYGLDGTVLEVN